MDDLFADVVLVGFPTLLFGPTVAAAWVGVRGRRGGRDVRASEWAFVVAAAWLTLELPILNIGGVFVRGDGPWLRAVIFAPIVLVPKLALWWLQRRARGAHASEATVAIVRARARQFLVLNAIVYGPYAVMSLCWGGVPLWLAP